MIDPKVNPLELPEHHTSCTKSSVKQLDKNRTLPLSKVLGKGSSEDGDDEIGFAGILVLLCGLVLCRSGWSTCNAPR